MFCKYIDQQCPIENCLGLTDKKICDHIRLMYATRNPIKSKTNMKCQFCPFINNQDLVCTGPVDRIGHECKGEVVPEISTFKKVKNVIGAFVKEAKEGVPISQAQIDERMRICEACELFNHEKQQCSLCSCYMKIKTTLSTASCPLDPPKWGPILD